MSEEIVELVGFIREQNKYIRELNAIVEKLDARLVMAEKLIDELETRTGRHEDDITELKVRLL